MSCEAGLKFNQKLFGYFHNISATSVCIAKPVIIVAYKIYPWIRPSITFSYSSMHSTFSKVEKLISKDEAARLVVA